MNKPKYQLLYFWAQWCAPCCRFKPLVESKVEKDDSLTLKAYEVDHHLGLVEKYRIMGVPTLCLMSENKELKRFAGTMTQNELDEWIMDIYEKNSHGL